MKLVPVTEYNHLIQDISASFLLLRVISLLPPNKSSYGNRIENLKFTNDEGFYKGIKNKGRITTFSEQKSVINDDCKASLS